MDRQPESIFPGPISLYQDRRLPEPATPAGYAALIDAYDLAVPLPLSLCAIGPRHKTYEGDGWRIFTPRHMPAGTLAGHLTFALRYEGLDLGVLKALFLATGPGPIEALVRDAPVGIHSRRIWFLYEWLLKARLDLPDATSGSYPLVVDSEMQWSIAGVTSTRHRVKNNLPGTPDFCPMVFRTPFLDEMIGRDLAGRARELIADVPADLLARTAAFLLLKDSRSSFEIEGERPPQDRILRWGKIIGEAGRHAIDIPEFLRLQRIVIGDARFVKLGLRQEGGFVGEHDRQHGTPIPEHISARHQDLTDLMEGLVAYDARVVKELDPVIAAAVMAFGFVYIHPFEDGNGRLHRFLIHHVLAAGGFNPPGMVFPVSAVFLDRIEEYRHALESYSRRLLPLIEWKPTARGNLEVLNETADFYRFFDATPHAEFLYSCVAQTVEVELPKETTFLARHDALKTEVTSLVDMPDRVFDLLFRFLQQNKGKLSRRARENEFEALTQAEVDRIEAAYGAAFPPVE